MGRGGGWTPAGRQGSIYSTGGMASASPEVFLLACFCNQPVTVTNAHLVARRQLVSQQWNPAAQRGGVEGGGSSVGPSPPNDRTHDTE